MDSEIPASTPGTLRPSYPQQRKSRTLWKLVPLILAFAGGVAATIWAVPTVRSWLDHRNGESAQSLSSAPDNAAETASAINPQSVTALEARLAAVSAKLDTIAQQASDAGGNAGRAEALLIAFAARRALDRGAPLGYLEGELRLRFADAQPRAVATVINAAAAPVTIPDLQGQLDELAPALAGTPAKTDWWDAAKRELSSLIIVRKAGAPSPEPQKVIERAKMLLAAGRVDAALAEVERMPNRAKADNWMQMARQYNEARRALDVIEAAAILEPREIASQPEAPDNAAAPAE